MNPIAAGVAGALISGVAMYTLGAKTTEVDAFTQEPAAVHAVDSQVMPAAYATALRPVAAPSTVPVRNARRTTTASQPVYREPVQREIVNSQPEAVREPEVVREDNRSWQKTAMIVGGSAAGGAGVGGIMGGKKGALIGAAIGGGAASIYEATQRR